MEPLPDDQQQLNTSRIRILRDELEHGALESHKKLLVDTFYTDVNRAYDGLRPRGDIDFNQFGIDADGRTL